MRILSVAERSSFIGFLKGWMFAGFFYGFSLNSYVLNFLFNVNYTPTITSFILDFLFIVMAILSICPAKKYTKILKQEEVKLNEQIVFNSFLQGFLYLSMAFSSVFILPIDWILTLQSKNHHIVWISSFDLNEFILLGVILLQIYLIYFLNKKENKIINNN